MYETTVQRTKMFVVYASPPCLLQERSSACACGSVGSTCVAVGSNVTVLSGGLTRVQSAFTTGGQAKHSRKMSNNLLEPETSYSS